jgi:hypothetical protein
MDIKDRKITTPAISTYKKLAVQWSNEAFPLWLERSYFLPFPIAIGGGGRQFNTLQSASSPSENR